MRVERFDTREALDAALASRLRTVIETGGALMLSGGNTPRPAYMALGTQGLQPARDLSVLFSDERYVPRDSEASNYHASLPLLDTLRLSEERVLRVRTELPLDEAVADYEHRLSQLLDVQKTVRLGVLGLGADGHTASLFSPVDLERAHGRLAIAVQRPYGMQAVSVTPGFLAKVSRLLIVVPGQDKREALTALLARDPQLVAWRAVANSPDVEVWCGRIDV